MIDTETEASFLCNCEKTGPFLPARRFLSVQPRPNHSQAWAVKSGDPSSSLSSAFFTASFSIRRKRPSPPQRVLWKDGFIAWGRGKWPKSEEDGKGKGFVPLFFFPACDAIDNESGNSCPCGLEGERKKEGRDRQGRDAATGVVGRGEREGGRRTIHQHHHLCGPLPSCLPRLPAERGEM